MTAIALFSTLAVQGALTQALLPGFDRPVTATFDPTGVLGERIAKGEPFDLIVAIEEFLIEQAAAGVVTVPVPLVSTGIGVAVRPGSPRPAIHSVEALKNALTNARSVAYSRTGASGIYFANLLERLGVAAAVNARATILPKGLTGEAIVDGRADLAIQQVSELMAVPGVEILGPLPAEVQQTTRFAVALSVRARAPLVAALLQHLTSPDAREAYRLHGLDICAAAAH